MDFNAAIKYPYANKKMFTTYNPNKTSSFPSSSGKLFLLSKKLEHICFQIIITYAWKRISTISSDLDIPYLDLQGLPWFLRRG